MFGCRNAPTGGTGASGNLQTRCFSRRAPLASAPKPDAYRTCNRLPSMSRLSFVLFTTTLSCVLCSTPDAHDRIRRINGTADKPLVGVQVKIQSFTPEDASRIRDTGFDFVRFGVWTDRLGHEDYRRQIDDAFKAAQSARLPVLLTVRALAPFAQAVANGQAGDAATSSNTATLAAAGARIADAVTLLTAQYGRELLAAEVWNEPDLSRYWPTGDVTRTFPPFIDGLCRRLAERRRTTPIVGFGFAHAPLPGSLPDRLLAGIRASASDCIDAVSYHAYGMTPAQIRAATRDIEKRYGVPAVVTEDGAPSAGAAGEQRQAARLQTLLDARNELGTPLLSVYEWADTVDAPDAAQRSYGIVRSDRTPKIALDAISASLRSTTLE